MSSVTSLFDRYHAAVMVIVAVLIMFPYIGPPVVQDIMYQGYEMSKILGVADDLNLCILADYWGIGGITAILADNSETECALVSKQGISYYDVIGVTIENKRSANLLFYFAYAIQGLMIGFAVMDMYLLFGGRKSTATALGFGVILTIAATMVSFQRGLPQTVIRFSANVLPWGRSLFGVMLTFMFSYILIFWIWNQFVYGFEMARRGKDRYKAIETAVSADLKRGETALKTIKR
ncbi:MAG: hypothetical protein GOU99_03630 [Candidatus Altiarchaeota archaeon]|nr:hypothetical protein [Candidatus Altiarchaeota archaeon]